MTISAAGDRAAQPSVTSSATRHDDDAVGATDKRRWISFLTWAFVLAEMAGRDGFLPTSAHAAEAETGNAGAHGEDGAAAPSQLPNVAVTSDTESSQPTLYQQAAAMPAEAASPTQPGELADPHVSTVPSSEPVLASSHGGGGGGTVEPATLDAIAADAEGVGVDLGLPSIVAIGGDGGLVDLGLQLDLGDGLQGLLGSVGNTFGALPVVGDAVESLASGVANTADGLLSTLQPVVSLVGINLGGDGGAEGLGVGQPGQLLFAAADTSAHELSTSNGGYTNYGIALSVGDAETSLSGTVDTASAIDALALDHMAGIDLHDASDALQLDQAILRSASDTLG